MNKLTYTLTIFFLFCLYLISYGQILKVSETEMSLSKAASKKGMYVNTTLTDDNNIRTFVSYDIKKGGLGFDVITVSPSNKLIDNKSEIASSETEAKYNIHIPEPGKVNRPGEGEKVLKLSQAAGVAGYLKVSSGTFEPVYKIYSTTTGYVTTHTRVLKGYKFKEKSKSKSDMKLTVYGTNAEKGVNLEENYLILNQVLSMKVGYFKKGARFAFIGKNAQWDKNSPNGSNVIISGIFDGKTSQFTNIKEHVLDYNVMKVTSGNDGENTLVLLSTLNAPSSVKAWAKYQAKGKHYQTLMSLDKEGNVTENITFQSKSSRGNFAVYADGDEKYVLGNINGNHEGYYRADVGGATHFQITVIKDGAVAKQEDISIKDLSNLVITPGGKKGKLKLRDIKFTDFRALPSGDKIAFATGQKYYYGFQFDSNAKIKQVYMIERIPEAGAGIAIETFNRSDNEMYVVFKSPLYRGFKKNYGYGLIAKNITFSRVDDALTFARIVKINTDKKSCSEEYDVMPNMIVGEDTFFKGPNGELLFPTKDKKGRYKMVKIN